MTLRVAALAAAGALVAAPAAAAGPTVDQAVSALRDDPVYVDPAAELADRVDAERLREEIERRNAGQTYVAVLPDRALAEEGGGAEGVLVAVADGLRRDGTFAVVVGDHFRAGSRGVLPDGVAGRLATEAFQEHRGEGVTAVLLDFVDRVGRARASGGEATGEEGDPSGGQLPLVALVALGAAGFGGWYLWRKRRREQAELEEVKAAANEDLVALAEDVQELEDNVDASGDREAQEAYRTALDRYDDANGAFDRARRPQDLERVTSALEEGRHSMALADALVHDRPAPERRPPCFFDPRHGPSSRDVEWAPPGGVPRSVPACEADAQRVERGLEPESREVLVGGERVPYWGAPAYYGPWAGGFFGPFGGSAFLSGLFVGNLLGGAFGGFGYGPVGYGGFGTWDDGGRDGGDFGGGDFGGGDFGGGDFGGGDF